MRLRRCAAKLRSPAVSIQRAPASPPSGTCEEIGFGNEARCGQGYEYAIFGDSFSCIFLRSNRCRTSARSRDGRGLRLQRAAQAEPTHQIVGQASPRSFHGGLQPASAAELSQAAAFLDPGMRELGDLRTSRVDLASFFGLHFGLEGGCRGRLLDTRDRAPPGGPRSPPRALLAPRTGAAGLLPCARHAAG